MIVIVDYEAGNIGSVYKAFKRFVNHVEVTSDPDTVIKADKLVVPGVGSFGDCMRKLRALSLDGAIVEFVKTGRPILGICVGLQIFFEESEESEGARGLGVIKGKVVKFPKGLKVPHMGWNIVNFIKDIDLAKGLRNNEYFYFVHSYYAVCTEKDVIAGVTEYDVTFPSVIVKDNIYLVQFHPEKSYIPGLKVIENFCKI